MCATFFLYLKFFQRNLTVMLTLEAAKLACRHNLCVVPRVPCMLCFPLLSMFVLEWNGKRIGNHNSPPPSPLYEHLEKLANHSDYMHSQTNETDIRTQMFHSSKQRTCGLIALFEGGGGLFRIVFRKCCKETHNIDKCVFSKLLSKLHTNKNKTNFPGRGVQQSTREWGGTRTMESPGGGGGTNHCGGGLTLWVSNVGCRGRGAGVLHHEGGVGGGGFMVA